jgi:hypothetical protein
MIDWKRRKFENSCLTGNNMPTKHRLRLWTKAEITVKGRPNWVFVKLHCHGLIPEDHKALLSENMAHFLNDMTTNPPYDSRIHFVTCREMFNIIAAASAGAKGDPEHYRDYFLLPPFIISL